MAKTKGSFKPPDMNWLTILLWHWCCFVPADHHTVEIDYYRPSSAGRVVTEEVRFSLHCNARRSLFFQITESTAATPPFGALRRADLPGDEERIWITKDFERSRAVQYAKSIQGTEYRIEEFVHPMQWEILTDTGTIAGIPVRKAKSRFRGRCFTAWYAPRIPLDNGPWKLGGLPGLILEAYDEKKEVVFRFRSLRYLGRRQLSLPAGRGRPVELNTYLAINRRELQQLVELIEQRLKDDLTDGTLDLRVHRFSSWEYPE